MGSSVTKRSKSWEKVPILGSYLKFRGQNLGYLSFILLEAKFGAPTRISEAKFGAKPPRPPNMEVPPWGVTQCNFPCNIEKRNQLQVTGDMLYVAISACNLQLSAIAARNTELQSWCYTPCYTVQFCLKLV